RAPRVRRGPHLPVRGRPPDDDDDDPPAALTGRRAQPPGRGYRPPMAHIDHDVPRIRYEDTRGNGPATLWSHGFLMDHPMFDPQVAGLDGYRHIRWDERGFGGTEATGPFSYWDSAEDAIALLDHLGIDSAVLAGMSQGGFLSLRAALTH